MSHVGCVDTNEGETEQSQKDFIRKVWEVSLDTIRGGGLERRTVWAVWAPTKAELRRHRKISVGRCHLLSFSHKEGLPRLLRMQRCPSHHQASNDQRSRVLETELEIESGCKST